MVNTQKHQHFYVKAAPYAGGVRCLFSVNSIILLILLKLIQFTQKHKQPQRKPTTIFHLFSQMFCVFIFPQSDFPACGDEIKVGEVWIDVLHCVVWHFHAVYPSVSQSASIHRYFMWKCTATYTQTPTIHRVCMSKKKLIQCENIHTK